MLIKVSNGEFFDKLSILKIKTQKLKDVTRLAHALKEYKYLLVSAPQIDFSLDSPQYLRLLEVNETLWGIEDRIRQKEKDTKFDDEFIELSRQIYFLNDERFRLKNFINQETESELREQKGHSTCY